MPADQVRWETTFSGRVQGVGFRYRTEQLAGRFPVQGYVRNLPDGRVELVAEGRVEDLEAFLVAVGREFGDRIRDRQQSDGPATGEFTGFGIRY